MPKELIHKPEIIVFAGPNGSGKTKITKKLLPKDFVYVNPDEITGGNRVENSRYCCI